MSKNTIEPINFIDIFWINLIQSDFYFAYNTKFPEEKKNNIIRLLDNLCDQLYSYIGRPHVDGTITIYSYATGGGFIEAYFANWMKYNNLCNICNIIFADPLPDILSTLNNYNIFDNILDGTELIDFRLQLLTKNRKGIINLYSNYKIDILLSTNPQNYSCKNLMACRNCKNIIGILISLGLIINNTNQLDDISSLLEWTNHVNMLWIFFHPEIYQSPTEMHNIKSLLANPESEYSKMIKEKFNYLRDTDIIMGPLINIQQILNIRPIGFDGRYIVYELINDRSLEGGYYDNYYKNKYSKFKNKYLMLTNTN